MAGSLLRFLAARGCERVLYLPGSEASDVSALRAAAFAGRPADVQVDVVRTELDPDAVVAAVRPRVATGPLTLVLDDDEVAVAVIDALQEQALRVPEDVGVVSWTDSVLCQSNDPTVTAINGRADEVGTLLGRCLLQAAGAPGAIVLTAPPPFVVARAST
jgi:DNA-binding LacI/PurR family transcriptional regulator